MATGGFTMLMGEIATTVKYNVPVKVTAAHFGPAAPLTPNHTAVHIYGTKYILRALKACPVNVQEQGIVDIINGRSFSQPPLWYKGFLNQHVLVLVRQEGVVYKTAER